MHERINTRSSVSTTNSLYIYDNPKKDHLQNLKIVEISWKSSNLPSAFTSFNVYIKQVEIKKTQIIRRAAWLHGFRLARLVSKTGNRTARMTSCSNSPCLCSTAFLRQNTMSTSILPKKRYLPTAFSQPNASLPRSQLRAATMESTFGRKLSSHIQRSSIDLKLLIYNTIVPVEVFHFLGK